MFVTNLRKVGGSEMLAVPPAILAWCESGAEPSDEDRDCTSAVPVGGEAL